MTELKEYLMPNEHTLYEDLCNDVDNEATQRFWKTRTIEGPLTEREVNAYLWDYNPTEIKDKTRRKLLEPSRYYGGILRIIDGDIEAIKLLHRRGFVPRSYLDEIMMSDVERHDWIDFALENGANPELGFEDVCNRGDLDALRKIFVKMDERGQKLSEYFILNGLEIVCNLDNCTQKKEMMDLLLLHGCYPNAGLIVKDLWTLEILINEYGANVNHIFSDGNTNIAIELYYLYRFPNPPPAERLKEVKDKIEFLVSHGADLSIPHPNGKTMTELDVYGILSS